MSGFVQPTTPNVADYTTWLLGQGFLPQYLPAGSSWIEYALNQALIIVNQYGQCIVGGSPNVAYTLAVYNCATHIQVKITPDLTVAVTGSISGTTMNVTGVTSGNIVVGMAITNLTAASLPLTVLAFGTGNGGLGTYTVSESLTISSTAINLSGTFFQTMRGPPPGGFNMLGFVPGVVQASADQGTSSTLLVPEFFKNLTIGDLNFLLTPWGREYLAYAQDFGDLWGMS
jgi:hypothetical protein